VSAAVAAQSAASVFSVTAIQFTEEEAACRGDECDIGGTAFCGLKSQTCQQTKGLPCIKCIAQLAVAWSSAPRCSGQECTNGGSQFCDISGQTCVNDADERQCFRCVGVSSSSVISQVAVASSSKPVVALADVPAFCGNGITDNSEQCDNGQENANKPNACRPNCTLSRCGDSIIDMPLELCDDGNARSGDGCSQTCQVERGKTETLPAQVIELPQQQEFQQSPVDVVYKQPSSAKATEGTPETIAHAAPPANPDTGPAALAVMISGASAGYAFMRRKR
jgi:cysteine-rich repeat protein